MVKIKKIHTRQRTKKEMLVRECNLRDEANSIVKITKRDALNITMDMLIVEWNLGKNDPPQSRDNLRNKFHVADNDIEALEGPIEALWFKDWKAQVVATNLIKAKTVAELRDQIWEGIPEFAKDETTFKAKTTKKHKIAAILLPIIIIFGLSTSVLAAEKLTAKSFAGTDEKLDEQEAALYLVYLDKTPLSELMDPGEITLNPKKVLNIKQDRLVDLERLTNRKAPWPWKQLDDLFQDRPEISKVGESLQVLKKIDGLTKEKIISKDGSTIGPFILRKNSAELTQSLSNAKGATLAYSKNNLKSGSGVLNSDGILDYPIKWNLWEGETGSGKSLRMVLDFASEWKLAQVQNDPKKEVEELTFSVPLTFHLSPGLLTTGDSDHNKKNAYGALFILQSKPYFVTDFSFRDEIYGVEANAEYVGHLLGLPQLYMGGFMRIVDGFYYKLRLIPKLDYSTTVRSGIHTTREEDDDWFRLGGTGSLDLRLYLQTINALDAGVSYQLFQAVSGSGGYSYLFEAHATFWLSENIGLKIEYSKGDTPVADNPIDLIFLGLEFKLGEINTKN